MQSRRLSKLGSGILFLLASCVLACGVAGAQATAATVCKDGTTSASSGRGACSGHGGVDKSATKASRRAANAPKTASVAQVTCTDGTTSKPGRGACSHHGGIAGATPVPSPSSARTTPSPTVPSSVPAQSPARTPSGANQAPSAARSGAREDNNPVGAIAQCKDGLYSHAQHRRGACSRHAGVAKWMTS